MNWLAAAAVDLATPIVVERSPARPLCDFLVQRRAAEWVNSCLRFADEETRVVAAGGWLEHYVFRETLKLVAQGLIQDTACRRSPSTMIRLAMNLMSPFSPTIICISSNAKGAAP